MYDLIRPLLFALEAEKSHDISMASLAMLSKVPPLLSIYKGFNPPLALETKLGELELYNPVGLAAGLDKEARAIPAFEALGFGFVEVGTVTPKAQIGNDKPRLFRLKNDNAIINRMGFNSCGLDTFVRNLEQGRKNSSITVGVNLGKNKDTPIEEAYKDYRKGIAATYHLTDYITINISSPNTPNLRLLQKRDALTKLIDEILDERDMHIYDNGRKPVFFKIAPDNSEEELEAIIMTANECQVDGIIATNTTIERPPLHDSTLADEIGGLSGKPLFPYAFKTLDKLSIELNNNITLIGVGGIQSQHDAAQFYKLGCDAIQIYSGFIYQGPNLISNAILGKTHL